MKSDCFGCAVLLCLVVCLFDLAFVFHPSLYCGAGRLFVCHGYCVKLLAVIIPHPLLHDRHLIPINEYTLALLTFNKISWQDLDRTARVLPKPYCDCCCCRTTRRVYTHVQVRRLQSIGIIMRTLPGVPINTQKQNPLPLPQCHACFNMGGI